MGRNTMWIDTHAHLDMADFDSDRDLVLQRAFHEDVKSIITVGVDLKSSKNAVALATRYPGLYAAVGLHPHEAKGFKSNLLEMLAGLTQNDKVIAWGEIGLDYFKYYSPQNDQENAFKTQLGTAVELGLPVIIHDREAHEDLLAILKKFGKRDRFGVVHCYSGDLELAQELFALGFLISIPGTITYKNASLIREVAAKAPLDKILIETDAPFLAPIPYRGKRNEPAFVAITARELARLRNMDESQLAEALSHNTKKLFGI